MVSVILIGGLFHAAVAWWPYPRGLDRKAGPGTLVLDDAGTPLVTLVASDGQFRRNLVLGEMGHYLPQAIVAVEDARFTQHGGVDWRSIVAATWQNVTSFRVRRGGSTLTMQLHRLRDPRPRTFLNKIEQAIRAVQSDRSETKETILAEYLNRAPFGGNLVGVGAASLRYFGRPCDQLSLAQAATLAGLPQSPNRYRPDRFPARALARRNHVLNRMLATGVISATQHDDAIREPLEARHFPLPQTLPIGAPGQGALPTLLRLAGEHPGKAIATTLNRNAQQKAFDLAVSHLAQLQKANALADLAIAVVVVDTQTARCLAAVSLGGDAPGVDLTAAPRSTGSALKPFIYAAAFDERLCTPQTLLNDSPAAWGGYAPRNFDGRFRGDIRASLALAESRNLPAIDLLARLGTPRVTDLLASLGLKSLSPGERDIGLSLATGGAEASPLELAGAYACLARGGTYRPVKIIASADSQEQHPSTKPLISKASCGDVLRALAAPDRTRAISPQAARLGVAWKTGTSSRNRDAICAAVSVSHTVVVWVGSVSGQPGGTLTGIDAAAPLALRLISCLSDPNPISIEPMFMPATDVATEVENPIASLTRPRPSRLEIVWPHPGEHIILDPSEPLQSQRVQIRVARDGYENEPIYWFVDGQNLQATSHADLWWTPTPGRHTLRATTASGAAATVTVQVHSGTP